MRIGIYKDTLANKRGADVAVVSVAEGLRERGHDVVLFEKGDFDKRIKESWDVVISTGTNEILDLAAAFVRFPWPVVQQFHTNPKSQFKWKRVIRNWKIRRALRRVSTIQILSAEFTSQVERFGVPVKVVGNWSGFNGTGFEDSGNASEEKKVIIYPGAFAKVKNQKLLIRAFGAIAADFPDWRLRLLGRVEGRYAAECRQLVARMHGGAGSRVEFAGFRESIAEEYRKCAFAAFPSLAEGFGLVIADAAAFSKPCVVTHDWIGTCGAKGGVLADSTVEAYAAGLKKLMSDSELRRSMGEKARVFCAEHYSRAMILDKWESLLSDVVDAVNGRNMVK